MTIPGRKRVYRLYGGQDNETPLVDYMSLADEDPPKAGEENGGVICRHPFRQQHRLKIFPLHQICLILL